MHHQIVNADDVIGVDVINAQDENLGKIEALMIDKLSGKIAYVVLSFGGFMGMGDKLFAMPWHLFDYNPTKGKFLITMDKERLKNSPGFDKNHWPDMTSPVWVRTMNEYYQDASRH